MYSNEYVLFLLTICLTLFNLKYLAVTEKSITFANVKQITIKIKQERDFIMSNEFDATKGVSVFKANVLGFLFKNYEYAYDVIRNFLYGCPDGSWDMDLCVSDKRGETYECRKIFLSDEDKSVVCVELQKEDIIFIKNLKELVTITDVMKIINFLPNECDFAKIRGLVCDILPCYDISRLLDEHPFYVYDSLYGELEVVNIRLFNNVVEFACMFNEGEDSYSSMVKSLYLHECEVRLFIEHISSVIDKEGDKYKK